MVLAALELPALDALQKERSDIAIFAVNVDREQAKAKAFLKQVPIDLPVVWDNQALALGAYQVLSMPTMFVVDKDGTLKSVKVGYSQERKLTELKAILEEIQ